MRGWLVVAVVTAGCAGNATVELTVDASPPVHGVATLRVTVGNAGATSSPTDFALPNGPVDLPPTQTLGLVFDKGRAGAIDVTVDALDGKGTKLATGQTSGTLSAGNLTNLSVTLGGGSPMVDGGTGQDASQIVADLAVDGTTPPDLTGNVNPCQKPQVADDDPITISGTTLDALGGGPIGGLAIAVVTETGNTLAQVMNAANGSFSISVPTGGKPLQAHLSFKGGGTIPATRWYGAFAQLDHDIVMANFPLVTSNELTQAYQVANVGVDMTRGSIVAFVAQCPSNQPIAGAIVTMAPNPQYVVYDNGNQIPQMGTMATSNDGIAYGMNAGPGTVVVGAALNGMMFPLDTIGVDQGGVTFLNALYPP